MERDGGSFTARAGELIRMLAAAAAAVRLYPETSPLRVQAIARFVDTARALTAANGPIAYHIDRERFVVGGVAVVEGQVQVGALAETMHALQAGQVIIAPGVTAEEIASFLRIIGGDTKAVRESGGIRQALLEADVKNIAVVEVTLRTSAEEGLLGLDLTAAPLEDIARELESAAGGMVSGGQDVVAEAIGRLEPAARDLAMQRCAEAMFYLDEPTRVRIMSAAVEAPAGTPQMEGLLGVISRMTPEALARLLRLTAESMGRTDGLADQIEFPPELAAELAAMMRPSPRSESDCGVPAEADAPAIVHEVAESDEEDLGHIQSLVRASSKRDAASRGLRTTMRMAEQHLDAPSVKAVADALGPAVETGAFSAVAEAAGMLARLGDNPALATEVQSARRTLGSPKLLEDCVRRLAEGSAEPAAVRTLLEMSGTAGAEALVNGYVASSEAHRPRIAETAVAMMETIAPVAGRMIRTGNARTAAAAVGLLGAARTRRVLSTIASALDHKSPEVRLAALRAAADTPGPEATKLLVDALGKGDAATRVAAAREIARTGRTDALQALLEVVETGARDKTLAVRKEALTSIEALHSPQAIPALERLAKKSAIGKRNRELRDLVRKVLDALRR